MIRLALAAAVMVAGVAFAPGSAGARPPYARVTWRGEGDFERNLSSLGIPTTMQDVSAGSTSGDLKLVPSHPNPIVGVAAGDSHVVVVRSDGTVGAVGADTSGETSLSAWTEITEVSAGAQFSIGLKRDGTVVAAGQDFQGATDVSGWSGITSIASGRFHTMGLRTDGTVVAVGDNYWGELDVSGWTDIVSIAAGPFQSVGLKSDGTVLAAGGAYGVDLASEVSTWTDIVAIGAAGNDGTYGVKRDGTVVWVGANQPDLSGWTDMVAVTGDFTRTLGLKRDGTVVVAGDTSNLDSDPATWTGITKIAAGGAIVGLKSDGTLIAADYATQNMVTPWAGITALSARWGNAIGLKRDGTVVAAGYSYYLENGMSSWTDITAVAQGNQYAVGLKSDGTVVATGYGYYGQTDVAGWSGITAIACGEYHTVGVKSDGTVLAVGDNSSGQCNVSGWTNIVAVATGQHHTVGLKSDGTVVAAGADLIGETGVSGWTDIVAIAAGTYHTVGLKRDGTVVAVGWDGIGTPDVSSWSGITAIAAGTYHTVGLRRDGRVVSAGVVAEGSEAVAGWTGITAIGAAFGTIGVKRDGTIVTDGFRGLFPRNFPTPVYPRIGTLGGTGSAVGLRCAVPTDSRLARVQVSNTPLWPGEAVKLAVRVSMDGRTWSGPLGTDGRPINWTSGTGNYFGQTGEQRVASGGTLSSLPPHKYIDIVVRLESNGASSPEVISVTAAFEPAFTISYTAGSGGWIQGLATQQVTYGANTRSVVARALPGYRFVSWSDGLKTAARSERGVTSSESFKAIFGPEVAAPVVTCDPQPSYTGSAIITATAQDEWLGSGVARMYYRIGDAATSTVEAAETTMTIGTPGTYTLRVWAVDNAGNVSPIVVRTVTVEKYPVTLKVSPKSGTFTLRRRDGVAHFKTGVSLKTPAGQPLVGKTLYLMKSSNGRTWKRVYPLKTDRYGKASKTLRFTSKGSSYWRWYSPSTAVYAASRASAGKVIVK